MLRAYVLIETEVGKVAHVAQALNDLDGVESAEDLAGPYDVIAKIFVLNRAQIRHRDLITVGQILTLPTTPMQPPPRLYKVRRGDTLSGIAEQQLGNANRWPEIFRLNRDIISDPDRITPGQVLVILPS